MIGIRRVKGEGWSVKGVKGPEDGSGRNRRRARNIHPL